VSHSNVLIELVIVLGTAAFVTIVFQALRLPVVLGYVLAGLLIGPHVPQVPLIANAELVHVLSELGVILLMFTIGLELRLTTIARVGLPAGLTALFEVGFTIAIGTLVAGLLGFGAASSLYIGACLGISSTMLAAKAFEELGWKGGFTEIVFAILIFEDVIAILLLALLAAVSTGAGMSGTELVIMLGKLAGFLVLMLAGGLLIVPRFFYWIGKRARSETLVIGALGLCFGASALAATAGYSVALGAFVAGVLIAESGQSHDVFELVRPLRDVFAMVFFVSIGMTIDPAELLAEMPAILALTVAVLIGKLCGVTFGTFIAGNGVRPAVRAGLSLAHIGEFSFVIASVAPAGDTNLLAIAVGVACLTTLTSSLLIRNSERISSRVAARLPPRLATFVSFYEAWLARLRAREASVFRRLRRPIIVLVLDAGLIVAIVIAASTLGPLLLDELELEPFVVGAILFVAAAALATPFIIGVVRRVVVIANQLASEVIPQGDQVDLGRAPRRALVLMLELSIASVVVVPAVAAIQPFVPGSPIIIVVIALVLLGVLRRSIADFDGHLRAGSELILEIMARPTPDVPLAAQVQTFLPGFEGLTTVTLVDGSFAIGRSLAVLDLRASTGATVLAIGRGAHGVATPSPTEPLLAGDVLALAGSDEAIGAARTLLEIGPAVTQGRSRTPTSEHHA
jgi:monovalent cation:H+ antiporter-2, CPA2 family